MSFDPIQISKEVAKYVCKNDERKYYRFRSTLFYGGCATADCVGCNLSCVYCWSNKPRLMYKKYGKFYKPEEVARRLVEMAKRKGFSLVRISGNEPTICREHLIKVISLVPDNLTFILETNGILIGYDESYAKDLSRFPNLYVRVSLKGVNRETFSKITGAIGKAFDFQIKAIENCMKYGIEVRAAIQEFIYAMGSDELERRLKQIGYDITDLELEPLILYPHVKERLRKAGLI